MYKIKKEDLTALFRAIAAEQELYVPVKTAGKVNFGPWSEDAEVDIDTLKSVKSPKDVFFPQSENLYTCEREGRKLKVEPEALKEQKFTVFGMRACDVQGVKVLDQVFLADPVDSFLCSKKRTWNSWWQLPVMSRRKAVFARYLVLTVQNRLQMWRPGSQEKNCTGKL